MIATGVEVAPSDASNARPSTTEAVKALRSDAPRAESYEDFFRRFTVPFYFDTRNPTGFLPRQFVIGPRKLREIGAVYLESSPNLFYYDASLMNEWDVMFWLPRISPTRLLP